MTKRKAVLVFGGPGLPEGSRTWYETPAGAIVQAFPGDEVEADQVKDLEGYIAREQASLKGEEVAESAPGK